MNWHSLIDRLGPYVWSAYGFVTVAFIVLIVGSRRRLAKVKKQLRERHES